MRTLIPVVQDDFLSHLTDLTVEQVKLFCLRKDGFAQELRVLPSCSPERMRQPVSAPPQRHSSAVLTCGTGTAADRSLKWRGLIDIHGS
jgi:hypothetical protein